MLFYDKRLSITNTHSCSACHEQARGFTVGTRFAAGVTGDLSHRNPMTLANAATTFTTTTSETCVSQAGAARAHADPGSDALEAFLITLTDDALLDDPKFSDPFK